MSAAVAARHAPTVRFFAGVMERHLRGSFRAARLARPGLPPLPAGRPVVVVTNHPSWWDPAFCILLHARLFPGRAGFAPIEAAMLARYRFFRRIGFFGVEEGPRGAAGFLREAGAILATPSPVLWITAQGRFSDPRERPLALRPGAAHLLARHPEAVALPLALEYPFWSERRPEALALFGAPLDGRDGGSAAEWQARLEGGLTAACDRLAGLAVARDPSAFETLAQGRQGVGGVYGLWLRARALARGERHRPEHQAEAP